MSRNTTVAIAALLLVALGGGTAAIWAYKKYKQKQNQEYILQGTMPFSVKEGVSVESVKTQMLNEQLLDDVVEKHQLVKALGVVDAAAAKAHIKAKFGVTITGTEVKVTYQGKDKELTEKTLRTIVNSIINKIKKNSPPPATQ